MKKVILYAALIIIIGCNPNRDKDAFDGALKMVDEQKYKEALNEFLKIVSEYPESEIASAALLECAKLYHNFNFEGLSKEESLEKAVEFYTRVYKEYPKSIGAPPSMMMTGFVLANELNQFEKAKTVYEEFLNQYPNSELIASVRIELENLGKTPDEILEKSIGANK
ncbi:MAG: tetratricopeptide repeat protein [Ignavibacteria bacterium]|nr:tetratricopeptide repeat protein [Ignavibacteria bacterium]